jgi:hypothetical protein
MKGVRWCKASVEMVTYSAAMATNEVATNRRNIKDQQNGYTAMLKA